MNFLDIERRAYKECGKPRKRQISLERVQEMRRQNFSQQDIARSLGVHTTTLRKFLRENIGETRCAMPPIWDKRDMKYEI